MAYYVRLMRQEDIPQVTEIGQEAFPTMWPPANYERELRNSLAHYIVAYEESEAKEPEVIAAPEKNPPPLVSRVRQIFSSSRLMNTKPSAVNQQCLVGFAGIWMMAGEAHITDIAVRKNHQQQGIGEHLLISIIDLATELKAHMLTLEVRASNFAAQNLYSKYGFIQAGIRRGYYTNDKEDALIMSLGDITSASFEVLLNQLKKAHSRKCGVALYHIGR